MTNSDTIAVTLQKTCEPCSLREGKLSVTPSHTEETIVRMGWLLRCNLARSEDPAAVTGKGATIRRCKPQPTRSLG